MKTKLTTALTRIVGTLFLLTLTNAWAAGQPSITLTASPTVVLYNGSLILTWKSVNTTNCLASGDWSGSVSTSGSQTFSALINSKNFVLSCTGANGKITKSLAVTVKPKPPVTAGSQLGVNLAGVCDWCNDFTFVDIMKQARGFAGLTKPWDPVNDPAPVDANGWPTQDFGVYFTTWPGDALGQPLTKTNPSFFGTYTLSFTGQATLSSSGSKQIINQSYNAALNTTIAQLVVGSADGDIDIEFTNTKRTAGSAINTGLQNIQLLRPGYTLGGSQIFTTAFLNALSPFSTLRFMAFLQTNGSPVTSWAARTPQSMPSQQLNTANGTGTNAVNSGVAWEYVIQLANESGKDIWINIPEGVDLTDTSDNNYITQLAQLLKANLKPNIHVYVEYSNELWNWNFSQTTANYNAAQKEISSGADQTLNFDKINNTWYWGYRRIVHQTVRISQLFAAVYGQAAINTTIRPVYMNQYVQPFLAQDGLNYLQQNFGNPDKYIYAIGGAPYFSLPKSYTTLDGFFTSLTAGANQIVPGFSGTPAYSGHYPVYSNISYQSLANYYGLKNVSYEGGPDVSAGTSAKIDEQANHDSRMNKLIQDYLANAFGCGNELFMYFELQGSTGDPFAIYNDFAVTTEKSAAINTVSKTPLANYNVCTSSIMD